MPANMNALDTALKSRWTESARDYSSLSDLGVKYVSKDYVDLLINYNINIRMSHDGIHTNNALATLHKDSEDRRCLSLCVRKNTQHFILMPNYLI